MILKTIKFIKGIDTYNPWTPPCLLGSINQITFNNMVAKNFSFQDRLSEKGPQGAVWQKATRATEKAWLVSGKISSGKRFG